MEQDYRFTSDYVDIFIKDGVLWICYKENARITEDKARIMVSERLKVVGNKSYPTLADCRYGTSIDKASRAIFAGPEATKNVTAGALLFGNAIHRMFIKTYLWFDNPKVPTAVFSDEKKALQWLELYKFSMN